MPDVFISHSTKDDAVGAAIRKALERQGLSLWVAGASASRRRGREDRLVPGALRLRPGGPFVERAKEVEARLPKWGEALHAGLAVAAGLRAPAPGATTGAEAEMLAANLRIAGC